MIIYLSFIRAQWTYISEAAVVAAAVITTAETSFAYRIFFLSSK